MAKTPFKMKGFSGFGNSPMKQTEESSEESEREKYEAYKRAKRDALNKQLMEEQADISAEPSETEE